MSDFLLVLCAVVLALLIRSFLFEFVRVRGASMESTLHNGDLMLVTRFDGLYGALRRFDVVTCRYPERYVRWRGHKLFPQLFVKRIIGLPGETVEIIDSVVHINGEPLDEPYLDPQKAKRVLQMAPRTLGENEYFMLGDHRDNSNDSRRIGPITRSMIRGRVRAVVLPWRHRSRLYAASSHT